MHRRWCCTSYLILSLLAACGESSPQADAVVLELDTLQVVGVADGDLNLTFGSIRDVEPGPRGSFFVLDPAAPAITWFDDKSQPIGGLRSQGAGPGELRAPDDIEADGEFLYVLDSGNARISRFGIASGGFSHIEDISLPLRATRFCVVDDTIFLQGVENGALLHRFTRDGSVSHSFAPVPALPEDLGRFQPTVYALKFAGPMLCDRNNQIILMPRGKPEIQAFSTDGHELWRTNLSGIREVQFTVSDRGALTPSSPVPNGLWDGRSIAIAPAERVLLQYDVWVDSTGPSSIETRVLDPVTGAEVGRTERLPLIVNTAGDLAYSYRRDPYPQVLVMRWR